MDSDIDGAVCPAAFLIMSKFKPHPEPCCSCTGHHGPGVTYAGLTLHAPSVWHTAVGDGMCGLMW